MKNITYVKVKEGNYAGARGYIRTDKAHNRAVNVYLWFRGEYLKRLIKYDMLEKI